MVRQLLDGLKAPPRHQGEGLDGWITVDSGTWVLNYLDRELPLAQLPLPQYPNSWPTEDDQLPGFMSTQLRQLPARQYPCSANHRPILVLSLNDCKYFSDFCVRMFWLTVCEQYHKKGNISIRNLWKTIYETPTMSIMKVWKLLSGSVLSRSIQLFKE